MVQQALLPAEKRTQPVRWIATYALGTAWAGLDRSQVVDEILLFAGSDRHVIERARQLVHKVALSDESVRRRADALLREALDGPAAG